MKKFFLLALGIGFVLTATFVSCNKINLATELGEDLIPPVDNIHTFDTLLDVETYNGVFDPLLDSFKMGYKRIMGAETVAGYGNIHILGVVDNDPLFGKTDSRIFFQVSPGRYPFKNRPGKMYIDSVVLALDYSQLSYGDTVRPQTINVSEIDLSSSFTADSSYQLNRLFPTTAVLGSKTFTPTNLKDSFQLVNYKTYGDTVQEGNQLRIRLNNSFGQRLLDYDSTGSNNGYSTDSVFRTRFKGFALQSVSGGGGLVGLNLTSGKTRLEVYYRYDNTTIAGDIDTAMAEFSFYSSTLGVANNASANYIYRDYAGTDVASGAGDQVPDPVVYIQNTPGTYSYIKVPKLAGFPNGIIHLAELQIESIYDASDSLFYTLPNIFLDVYDSSANRFKLMPSVFSATPSDAFGTSYILTGYETFYSNRPASQPFFYKLDPSNNRVKELKFNITRYAQEVVSDKVPAYLMRLYAPAYVELPLDVTSAAKNSFAIPQNGLLRGIPGFGRIRFGGGNHPTQKMKLRIVYSKI